MTRLQNIMDQFKMLTPTDLEDGEGYIISAVSGDEVMSMSNIKLTLHKINHMLKALDKQLKVVTSD